MPKAPKRLCKCGKLVQGKCQACHKGRRQRNDRARGTVAERGYGADWRRLRGRYIKQNPLCEHCLKRGRTKAAEEVDHVVPHKGNERLRMDFNNLQSLCKSCHSRKTVTEDGGFGRG